jgi:nitrile hydratase accessory protein
MTAPRDATDPRDRHDLGDLPGLPLDPQGGPVFREPWQAQAFAMAVRLHEAGHFTWTEWAAALADQIQRAQRAGDPDLGDTYYLHWLAALEQLVAAKGLVNTDELARRKEQWAEAARTTPHGAPIELEHERID